MGRGLSAIVVAAAVIAALAPAASAAAPISARVEHLGTLPAPAGIGANFKNGYMFVTATSGLYVYDVRDAAHPAPVSVLPLPHYENEDVSIGGNRLLLSGDGTLGGGAVTVVDISNPAMPRVERVIKLATLGGPGHTATCIQDCHYAWVAGYGSVYVLNLDQPDQLPGLQLQQDASQVEVGDLWTDAEGNPTVREFGWSTHDVQVDEAGYAWVVGGDGTVAFDVRPESYPVPDKPYPQNLLEPRLVARTGPAALNDGDPFDDPTAPDPENSKDTVNDFIHHNSWRPDATEFSSRPDAELNAAGVRPGELVLITEEDIWSRATASTTPGGCETQGSFQTWQVKQLGDPGPDDGTVANLDSWTTEFNELIQGDDDEFGRDLVPTKGFCSSHYFSERDGLVAVAWYEQGTRLLDVSDPRDIKQVAFFLPPGGTTWAAYWSPTDPDIVYAVDNNRGVDVLRVDREAADEGQAAVRAPLAPWWFDGSGTDAVAHPKFGFVCRLPL